MFNALLLFSACFSTVPESNAKTEIRDVLNRGANNADAAHTDADADTDADTDADAVAADLAWARKLNGPQSPKPPTEFRAGHVTPRVFDSSAIQNAEGRFEVRFPSGAPITTPAVHDGMIFSSGGFKGKEFYAFDAKTGAFQWGRDLDDDGPSAPACDAGVCVFNTESCTVFALDAKTGEQLWSWWMGDPMLSAPAIADGVVYTSYPAGQAGLGGNLNHVSPPVAQSSPEGATHVLAALDLKTGALKWQRWLDGDIISAPVVVDGEVFVTTFSGTMMTFGATDGAVRAARRGRATSAPTVSGGEVYWSERSDAAGEAAQEQLVAASRGTIHAEHYTAAERDAPYLDASVQSATGYAAGGMSLDAGNGFSGGAPASANAGRAMDNVGQGTVSRLQAYQGSKILNAFNRNYAVMGDEIVSTDPRTGEARWTVKIDGDLRQAGGFLAAPPALAGEMLVVATLSGDVLFLDPKTGDRKRTIEVGAPIRSQPIVEAGWLYVGTEDGRLIGIDTGDLAMTGWPMWGGDAARSGT
ncbi:MAG: PQQ-binding-like beta-propeller repeat protein [Myxococcota bacterium]